MNTIKLAVHSSIYNCELEFKHRLNIIIGDSGVGKTSLVDILNVPSPQTQIKYTYPVVIAGYTTWKSSIQTERNSLIIFDDLNIVESDEFSDLISKYLIKSNLYVLIISRAIMPKISTLSYSIHAIYEMYYDETLINHYIREYYHKLLPEIDTLLNSEIPICYITEDTTAGYQFFKTLIDKNDVYHSTSGKSTMIRDTKEKLSTSAVVNIIDTAAYGCHIEEFVKLTKYSINPVTLLYDFECFEEVLVRSNLLNDNVVVQKELNDLPKYANQFKSWENYFQDLLLRVTKGKLWKQSHGDSKLNKCFLINCIDCNEYKRLKCSKAQITDKFEFLLKGTKFEYLLKFRKSKQEQKDTTKTNFFS